MCVKVQPTTKKNKKKMLSAKKKKKKRTTNQSFKTISNLVVTITINCSPLEPTSN